MFREVVCDEGIVLRLAQERSHPFEGFDEFGEAAVGIAAAHFLFGYENAVTSRERADGGRLDGAFEVQMKFRLGQRSDSNGERRRGHP